MPSRHRPGAFTVAAFGALLVTSLGVAAGAVARTGNGGDVGLPDWVTFASVGLPFAIAWVRRARPIGGWLFVYLWEGVARAVLAVAAGVAANLDRFGGAAWHGDHVRHLAFLLAAVPPVALAALEMLVAIGALRPAGRSAGALRRLRLVLGLEVGAGLVSAGLDSVFWPQNLVFSAPGLAWPVLWSAYFRRSKRVGSVFRPAT